MGLQDPADDDSDDDYAAAKGAAGAGGGLFGAGAGGGLLNPAMPMDMAGGPSNMGKVGDASESRPGSSSASCSLTHSQLTPTPARPPFSPVGRGPARRQHQHHVRRRRRPRPASVPDHFASPRRRLSLTLPCAAPAPPSRSSRHPAAQGDGLAPAALPRGLPAVQRHASPGRPVPRPARHRKDARRARARGVVLVNRDKDFVLYAQGRRLPEQVGRRGRAPAAPAV